MSSFAIAAGSASFLMNVVSSFTAASTPNMCFLSALAAHTGRSLRHFAFTSESNT